MSINGVVTTAVCAVLNDGNIAGQIFAKSNVGRSVDPSDNFRLITLYGIRKIGDIA